MFEGGKIMGSLFDTFISYRRDGGSSYAGSTYDYLVDRKFHPFYDRTGMENGRFDEQIRINLINSENYLLILSINSLDRTVNDDDWVRKEIKLALDNNLNIIVLMEEGFVFPTNLPSEIQDITKFQQYTFKNNSINNTLKEIESKLLRKSDQFTYFDPNAGGKIHIGGDYLTIFEDEENGRIITRKAPAHLTVIGNSVYGKTSFNSTSTWKIKGRVHKKKRVTGLYYAKSILDDGFGTFYLEAKSPSILEGYWCGYDNANNKIFCGKYIFKKIFTDYIIRPIKKEDFSKIIYMSDEQLGKDYVNADLLRQALTGKDCFCYVVENKNNHTPIGFSFCMSINSSKLLEITHQKEIKELKFYEKIGYIKTIVVDKKYEGFGIATKLVLKSLEKMEQDGCEACISTAWKHCGITNIANVLLKNGFIKKLELSNYWYEDSIKQGYLCPQCGNPCHCSCVIYVKF